jgi:hypothetical protein
VAKGKKGTTNRGGSRTRVNPLTGKEETVAGTKAGKKRTRLPAGDPLRTHDIHAPAKKTKGKSKD